MIGTCKKLAWTLMVSCGNWDERESKCVLSMRVVGFFEWVGEGVVLYINYQYLAGIRYSLGNVRLLVEDRMGGPP